MSIRVLHVSFFNDPRGRRPDQLLADWPSLAEVAMAARDAGFEVDFVHASCCDDVIERAGVRYHFVAERPGSRGTARRPRRLLARARRIAPQLLHVHGLGFALQTWQLAMAVPQVPIVLQDHCDRPARGWRRPIHKLAFANAAGVMFTARELATPFVAAGILSPNKPVYEVLEGSTRFTTGDRAAARALTGLSGAPCVLWVGRLNQNKDPLTILAAFSQVVTELPDARLYMCYSDATLLAQVQDTVRANSMLEARVQLLGHVAHDEMQNLYRAADLFVLGSHHEGSGFALVEAIACGVTPVVTDIAPFRAITQGVVGELFEPGDANACARALLRLGARDRVHHRPDAVRHFEKTLSYECVGQQLKAAYEAVLAC